MPCTVARPCRRAPRVARQKTVPLLPTPRSALFLASALPGATFYVVAGGARFTRRSRSTRGNHAPCGITCTQNRVSGASLSSRFFHCESLYKRPIAVRSRYRTDTTLTDTYTSLKYCVSTHRGHPCSTPPTAVTMLVRRAAEHMLLCDSAVVAAIAATLRTQRSELRQASQRMTRRSSPARSREPTKPATAACFISGLGNQPSSEEHGRDGRCDVATATRP